MQSTLRDLTEISVDSATDDGGYCLKFIAPSGEIRFGCDPSSGVMIELLSRVRQIKEHRNKTFM